jgi:hypothetical protein
MYNVLERQRLGRQLTEKERTINEQGLVSVLRQLHDELDIAILEAYGWTDLIPILRVANSNAAPFESSLPEINFFATRAAAKIALNTALLERLVLLNTERAAEEARGIVRWLRPEFQNPDVQNIPQQTEIATDSSEAVAIAAQTGASKPLPWPKDTIDQVRAVADVLAGSSQPLSIDDIATRFTARGAWKKRLPLLIFTSG